jgi:hypothetical protein
MGGLEMAVMVGEVPEKVSDTFISAQNTEQAEGRR